MNRMWHAVVLSLLAVTLSAPALAQDATAKKVTLDLNGVAPAAAFKAVADAIGVTVTVDAAVTDPIDITVRNVSAKTALDAMCESVGCRWTIAGNTLAVNPLASAKVGVMMRGERGATVDKAKAKAHAQATLNALKQKLPAGMKFENAPLAEVGRRLSEALNLKVQLTRKDATVETLTMDFSDRTLQESLKLLGEQQAGPEAAWRLTIGPQSGDEQAPTIAIMVAPRTVKKTVTKR